MTVLELKEIIKELPDEMEVRYNYDTGHSYPTFVRAFIGTDGGGGPFLCLDEGEEEPAGNYRPSPLDRPASEVISEQIRKMHTADLFTNSSLFASLIRR